MSYKIIALDLDGTLTNSRKIITPKTRNILMRFQQNGGRIILASGRPTHGVVPHANALRLSEFGGYIMSYNGGSVTDCKSGDVVFEKTLPQEVIPEICDIIKDYNVGINTYEGKNIILANRRNKYSELESKINGMPIRFVRNFSEYVNFNVNKCLLQGEPEEILKLEKILSDKYKGRLGIFKSEAFFLEIVPYGIDKAASIDRLIKSIGIKAEECIACGDGFNDISMIKYAGMGVAMSNAIEPVIAAADCVTKSNDEDGIEYLFRCIELSTNLFGVA